MNRWGVPQSRFYLYRNQSPESRTRRIVVSTRICIRCLSRWVLSGKNSAISLGSVHRAPPISYSPVRPANTIICRFERDALFPFPLFSNFTSTPCFSEQEMRYVRRKIDKNMAVYDGKQWVLRQNLLDSALAVQKFCL